MKARERAVLACRPASDDGKRLKGNKMSFSALKPVRRLDIDAGPPPVWRI
jgi:hypothetical protein